MSAFNKASHICLSFHSFEKKAGEYIRTYAKKLLAVFCNFKATVFD